MRSRRGLVFGREPSRFDRDGSLGFSLADHPSFFVPYTGVT